MANNCEYVARIVGRKRKDVERFIRILDCRDSMLAPGKRRATAKQTSYDNSIAKRIGLDPNEEPAKDIYSRFISTHVAEFKRRATDPVPLTPRTPGPEPETREQDGGWGHGYCGWDYPDTDDTHIGPP